MDTNLDQLERGGGTIQGAGIRDYLQTNLFHICIQIIFASGDSMIAAAGFETENKICSIPFHKCIKVKH